MENEVQIVNEKNQNHLDVTSKSQQNKLSINGHQTSTDSNESKKNQYRLVIHIDKIRVKPGPKSEKLLRIRRIRNKLSQNVSKLKDVIREKNCTNSIQISDNSDYKHTKSLQNKRFKSNNTHISDVTEKVIEDKANDVNNIKGNVVGCPNGCKLQSTFFNKKQVVYCCQCNRAYMHKQVSVDKKHRCLICKQCFDNSEILTDHIKQHSTCGTCGIECYSKDNLEKHTKLHIGRPPHFPFKCHLCTEVFRKEEHVRSHLTNKHYVVRNAAKKIVGVTSMDTQMRTAIVQTLIEVEHPLKHDVHRCIPCNITFRNEEAFQRHVNSHKTKEAFTPAKLEPMVQQWQTTVTSLPLSSPPLGQLCPVKFTCRVCSQELTSVAEIDAHTKSHMNVEMQHSFNCTMCDKLFVSQEFLNEHVREHLARAHRCPICSKAFISRATLQTHLQTHRDPDFV